MWPCSVGEGLEVERGAFPTCPPSLTRGIGIFFTGTALGGGGGALPLLKGKNYLCKYADFSSLR